MKLKLAVAFTAVALSATVMTGSVSADHLAGLTKADCRKGGFAEYQTTRNDPTTTFKNQGQCIKFVTTGKVANPGK